ncbi:MAG: hypothetical protein CSB55_06195 [Candidatus Cloacimonadota bacterium]|nr:MAG: hypothetical protein CSB55_06195 [Candidatus Cloacimonadota bacterium]
MKIINLMLLLAALLLFVAGCETFSLAGLDSNADAYGSNVNWTINDTAYTEVDGISVFASYSCVKSQFNVKGKIHNAAANIKNCHVQIELSNGNILESSEKIENNLEFTMIIPAENQNFDLWKLHAEFDCEHDNHGHGGDGDHNGNHGNGNGHGGE